MKLKTLLLLFTSLLIVPSIYAAEITSNELSLGVNPAIVEVALVPGKEQKAVITVFNLSKRVLPIKISKSSFSSEEIKDIPEDMRKKYDASSWMSLSDEDSNFLLQPEEQKKITVNIKPGKGSAPGGHYASLTLQPLVSEEQIKAQSLNIGARVSVLFLMTVKGKVVEDVTLEKMTVLPIYTGNPVMKVRLKNRGNSHVLPSASLHIFNNKDKKIKVLNTASSLLLPGLEKEYLFEWKEKDISIGSYQVQTQIAYGVNNDSIKTQISRFTYYPHSDVTIKIGFGAIILAVLYRFRRRVLAAIAILLLGTRKENKETDVNHIDRRRKRL